ncbi:MAG: putative ZPR1 zinc-finger domain protein, partial [Streblomastix strix]
FNAGRKGEISTVEGIISKTAESLEQEQPVRKICEPDIAVKIDNFIQKLKSLLDRSGNQRNFTFVIDDPTGNSFVQNILAPLQDPKCKSRSYTRSREQCEIIGLSVPPYEENSDEKEKENNQELSQNEKETNKDQYKSEFNIAHLSKIQLSTLESQVLKVASPEDIVEMVLPCSCCSNQQGIMRTITASIPLFKQIVLMAYSCEQCGYRN